MKEIYISQINGVGNLRIRFFKVYLELDCKQHRKYQNKRTKMTKSA